MTACPTDMSDLVRQIRCPTGGVLRSASVRPDACRTDYIKRDTFGIASNMRLQHVRCMFDVTIKVRLTYH